jgi:hypothetical protein
VVAPVLAPVPGVPAPPPPETALVLASSKAREIKPRPADFPADTVFNGELLRKVRTAQGITLDDIAARTRISRKTLENVEADRYADLPAHVYLRGTLMGIATTLGLDPIRVAKSYLDLCQAAKPPAKR